MPTIEDLAATGARDRQQRGAVLVDVREPDEHATGVPDGAIAVPRAALEAEPTRWLADPYAEVLLICGSGRRSRRAAEALAALGYTRLASVEGGIAAWRAACLPVGAGAADDAFLDRYSRHLRLPQVGLDG